MAETFRDDPNVILAPWGETTVGWKCFMQKGCDNQATYGPDNAYYLTAPMQQAVDLMRTAGYHGVISIPCIEYANMCGTLPDGSEYDGSTWLKSRPTDPENQMIAEAHVYGLNYCDEDACFDSSMKPITEVVPMIFGETGETYDGSDCGPSYISTFMTWADANGVGYEAWTWDTCGGCGVLISNYEGTPSCAWAEWVKNHYLSRRDSSSSGISAATISPPAQDEQHSSNAVTFTSLVSFDGTNGIAPAALVQATNGNFYGTTDLGGANGDGTVFKITPGGTLTTLHSFDGTNGQYPE